jgi:ubiquinol-cytochrome c reductase cytochrome b subunit
VVGRADEGAEVILRRLIAVLDTRTGVAPLARKALRYVFPDHWSFLLGEVALYAFMVLVGTGIYLTFFFEPSHATVVYHGAYEPLRGQQMSEAYRSVVDISVSVKAGLLIRQAHHWAANIFMVAIVLHLLRIFFTGAYRKPRELTYYIGLTILVLGLLEAYVGYSMVDDLLSGMGLAIGYSVLMSVPFVGANLAALIWGAAYPGTPDFWPRMYIAHVLLLPIAIGLLLGLHLVLVAMRHHSQFRRTPKQTEQKVVGSPMFPSYMPRSIGLTFVTAGVIFLLGGLIQINPIWQWGPYHVALSTNGAQPDWYLGWLIGALRLMPDWEPSIGGYTLIPNPFFGGVLVPGLVFGILYLWPTLERLFRRDRAVHNLLERPRDAPRRTGVGMALFTFAFLTLLAGSADRAYVTLGIPYVRQVHVYEILVLVLPLVAYWITVRVCRELLAGERVAARRHQAEAEAEAAGAAREGADAG